MFHEKMNTKPQLDRDDEPQPKVRAAEPCTDSTMRGLAISIWNADL